jgi:hypothetical protein
VTDDVASGGGALERHYRVTLDLRLLVRPLTPEVCQESFFFNDRSALAGEPSFREHIERQRRLYDLLRSDPAALEAYVLSAVMQAAGCFAMEGLMAAFDARECDEVLEPLCERMGGEDARFFDECRREGVLSENTDLIGTAVKVEWVGAAVEEVGRRVEGDVGRAEAVERVKTRLIRKFKGG